jgi:hypothetical protein
VTKVPPLNLVDHGRFEAQCCQCQRFSLPVVAVGLEHAWTQLLKTGWTWQDGNGLCPECWAEPVTDPKRRKR